ncbi:hypothetical protein ACFL6W_03685 [Thermodesulfobacteriota bacterium]
MVFILYRPSAALISQRLIATVMALKNNKDKEMNKRIPVSKLLVAYFTGGFVGGYIFGILNTHSITISFLYSLIVAVSLSLAEASTYYIRKKIIKALTFGIVLGVSGSCFSYYLLNPNKSFLHFTIPIICGCIVGGSLYNYLHTLRSQN